MINNKILLFIPVYNCAPQIKRVIKKIDNIISQVFSEIIIIDNCSSDNTINEAIKSIQELKVNKNRIKVFQNLNNVSLGGSHKAAFQYAVKNKFDYVAVFHGDDQGDINDLVKAIKSKKYEIYDFYLGSRFLKESDVSGYSKIRIIGNIFFNQIFSIILRKKIKDLGAGVNIFNVQALSNKFYINFPNSLTFNYYLTFYICIHNLKFNYFPHKWTETDQISNIKIIKIINELFLLILKLIFNKKKFFKMLKNSNTIYKLKIFYEKN